MTFPIKPITILIGRRSATLLPRGISTSAAVRDLLPEFNPVISSAARRDSVVVIGSCSCLPVNSPTRAATDRHRENETVDRGREDRRTKSIERNPTDEALARILAALDIPSVHSARITETRKDARERTT